MLKDMYTGKKACIKWVMKRKFINVQRINKERRQMAEKSIEEAKQNEANKWVKQMNDKYTTLIVKRPWAL